MQKIKSKQKLAFSYFKQEYVYFFVAILSLSLVSWQHYGMNHILDVFPDSNHTILASGDEIYGGHSKSSLIKTVNGVLLHCETKPSPGWPFCNLEVNISDSNRQGINLEQYDHLLLTFKHQSSVQDTVLVYLINTESQESQSSNLIETSDRYIHKNNMTTILPTSGRSIYRLPLKNFSVPSWWLLKNNLTGKDAEPNLNNVTTLSIATGDSNATRSVDILLEKVQFTGKWITANSLYLYIIFTWITIITINALYRVYQLAEQLKINRQHNKKLEEINSFLSIQKEEFEALAKTDPLTGLYNRAGTRELLQRMQDDLDGEYSLIMFDIDHFKMINDTYGHEIGDSILCSLAKCITAHMRETDHVARWGGEEFIILCSNTKLLNAAVVANNLRQQIANTPLIKQISVTCSFGVSQYQNDIKDSIQSMFEVADVAMYTAKKMGRNRVEIGVVD
ncbi:MAG: GGDEF domain-containing protein [Psychromonas sp.]